MLKNTLKNKGFALSMAVMSGIVFANAVNLVTGVCCGIMMGIAFGLFSSDKDEKQ